MAQNKKTKKKQKSIIPRLSFGLVTCAVLFMVGVGSFLLPIHASKKTIQDSPKTEMKRVPQQFKKVLAETTIQSTVRIPILMYHYVEYIKDTKDKTRALLNIQPHIFDEQVKTLKAAGYTFLTARDVGLILDGQKMLPDKPIVLTFDDGHWDLDTDVLPILKKYNVSATAYIVPGLLGGSDYLTDGQLRDVIGSGLVEIAAHTINHVSLKGLALTMVKHEVEGSKEMLEKTYHVSVVSFAYPNGSFDETAGKIVKEAGFSNSVSTIPGIMQSHENLYFLYRLRPGGRTGEELLHFLSQETFKPW
ncbi:polysaccharide deacetylase family protein [soil metagenome]